MAVKIYLLFVKLGTKYYLQAYSIKLMNSRQQLH